MALVDTLKEVNGTCRTTPKDDDTYNIDVVKVIAGIINHQTMAFADKQDKLVRIIDAVYVDGWDHGYTMVRKDCRESNSKIRGIANAKVS